MRVESQDPKSWCLINGQNYANTARATTMRYISIFLSINNSIIVSRNVCNQRDKVWMLYLYIQKYIHCQSWHRYFILILN